MTASQTTQSLSMAKANQVLLCTEITGVECKIYMNRKIYCVAKLRGVKMLQHVLLKLKKNIPAFV